MSPISTEPGDPGRRRCSARRSNAAAESGEPGSVRYIRLDKAPANSRRLLLDSNLQRVDAGDRLVHGQVGVEADFRGQHHIRAELQGDAVQQFINRRIGVDYAGSWARRPLRYYIKNSPYVSGL